MGFAWCPPGEGIVLAIQSTMEEMMETGIQALRRLAGKPGCDYCGNAGARTEPYKDGNVTVYAHPACRAKAKQEESK